MKRSRIRRLVVLVLLGLAGSVPRPTEARPPAKISTKALAEAKASFKLATAAYDAGRYEEALRSFQRAHELSRNPVLYFNLAACAEKLAQPRVAAAHLRAYLAEVPNAEDALEVRERLGSLEERARQEAQRDAEEERRAEEEARHKKLDPASTVNSRQSPTTTPTSVQAARVDRPSTGRRHAGGLAMLGVTLAFGATAAGLGTDALLRYRRLESECGTTGCGERVDPVRSRSIAADVFMGLTGAAAVTTIILFAIEARRPRPRVVSSTSPAETL